MKLSISSITKKFNAKRTPDKLYKYMWFNPDVIRKDENYYQRIFTKKYIYFPTVAELNDPYDCYPSFSLEGCDVNKLKKFLIEHNIGKHPTEEFERMKEVINNGKLDGISKSYYESGQLLYEVIYKDDKQVGIGKKYSESEQLKLKW